MAQMCSRVLLPGPNVIRRFLNHTLFKSGDPEHVGITAGMLYTSGLNTKKTLKLCPCQGVAPEEVLARQYQARHGMISCACLCICV